MENRSLLYAQRRRNDAAVLKIQKQRFVKVRQHSPATNIPMNRKYLTWKGKPSQLVG